MRIGFGCSEIVGSVLFCIWHFFKFIPSSKHSLGSVASEKSQSLHKRM